MRALFLKNVTQFSVESVSTPSYGPTDVRLRVAAVGICGTDFHIYEGLANYHLDGESQPVPLPDHPQILGHEFAGLVETMGDQVTRCKAGDLVVVDQVLNCSSQNRTAVCEYCRTGDSHQCEFGREYGITGLPGALSEFVAVPEVNVVVSDRRIKAEEAALAEPLGCVIHAQDRVEHAQVRYSWGGERPIQHVAILGAGPSGLLFLQYLRKERQFTGEILVVDQRDAKLALACRFGGTPVDTRREDPADVIRQSTRGEGLQYVIEATGNGQAFGWIPRIVRRQATLLLYGAGHANLAPGCLTPCQAMELAVVTSAGASGCFDSQGGSGTYEKALRLIEDRTIDVGSIISHRYQSLEELATAFAVDRHRDDFIKAVFVPNFEHT